MSVLRILHDGQGLFQLRGVIRQSCSSLSDIACRSAFSLIHVMLHTLLLRSDGKAAVPEMTWQLNFI